jgi:hypothetical protein
MAVSFNVLLSFGFDLLPAAADIPFSIVQSVCCGRATLRTSALRLLTQR